MRLLALTYLALLFSSNPAFAADSGENTPGVGLCQSDRANRNLTFRRGQPPAARHTFVSFFPDSGQPGSTGSWSPPDVDLLGVGTELQVQIKKAREEATQEPKNPEKVGYLGMVFFTASLPTAAAQCFEHAGDIEPAAIRWKYYLALAYRDSYESEKAIKNLQKAVEIDPKYSPAYIELGDLTYKTDPSKARGYYEKALELEPQDARSHFGLGLCNSVAGNTDEAIKCFRRAVEASPSFGEAHAELAKLYLKTNQEEEARIHRKLARPGSRPTPLNDVHLMDLLRLAGGSRQLVDLARQMARSGDMAKSMATLVQANKASPDDIEVHFALGSLLNIMGQYDQAAPHLREVLQAQPFRLPAVLGLAKALTHIGAYTEARQIYEEVLTKQPDNLEAQQLFAAFLIRSGNPKRAQSYLEKLIQADPKNPRLQLEMAKTQFCERKFDLVCKEYAKAAELTEDRKALPDRFCYQLLRMMVDQHRNPTGEIDPSTLPTLSDVKALGKVFSQRGLTDEAKALEGCFESLCARVLRLADRGAFEQALRFAKLVLVDKDSQKGELIKTLQVEADKAKDRPGIRHLLALVLLETGDRTGAAAEWEKIVKQNPDFGPAYYAWADLLIHDGDYAGAQKLLRAGLEKIPDSSSLANALAWALATAPQDADRKGDEAIKWAEQARSKLDFPDPEYLDTLATAQAAAGHFDKAIEIEKSAIELAIKMGRRDSVTKFTRRLKLFADGKPYLEAHK